MKYSDHSNVGYNASIPLELLALLANPRMVGVDIAERLPRSRKSETAPARAVRCPCRSRLGRRGWKVAGNLLFRQALSGRTITTMSFEDEAHAELGRRLMFVEWQSRKPAARP